MKKLKKSYYAIMSKDELGDELIRECGELGRCFIKLYNESYDVQKSELDAAISELNAMEDDVNGLEYDLESLRRDYDGLKSEFESAVEKHDILRKTIVSYATHGEWVLDEENGFELTLKNATHHANMTAKLRVDTEVGRYILEISPRVNDEVVEFEAETLTEAKAVALNRVLVHMAENDVACYRKADV